MTRQENYTSVFHISIFKVDQPDLSYCMFLIIGSSCNRSSLTLTTFNIKLCKQDNKRQGSEDIVVIFPVQVFLSKITSADLISVLTSCIANPCLWTLVSLGQRQQVIQLLEYSILTTTRPLLSQTVIGRYLGNRESYHRSAGVITTGKKNIWQIPETKFLQTFCWTLWQFFTNFWSDEMGKVDNLMLMDEVGEKGYEYITCFGCANR